VRYFDHHFPGAIPEHARLEVHIENLPDKGTSLLVDDFLGGRFRAWAVVGTFGDNFEVTARQAAKPLGLDEARLAALRELGICLNYNGYGARLEDLHFPPDQLYQSLRPYADPLEFIAADDAFKILRDGYTDDMEQARSLEPELVDEHHGLYVLPAKPWARRASGVLANELAQAFPRRAHALLTRLPEGGFVVSVRAPLAVGEGADELCRQFPTGALLLLFSALSLTYVVSGRRLFAALQHVSDGYQGALDKRVPRARYHLRMAGKDLLGKLLEGLDFRLHSGSVDEQAGGGEVAKPGELDPSRCFTGRGLELEPSPEFHPAQPLDNLLLLCGACRLLCEAAFLCRKLFRHLVCTDLLWLRSSGLL